MLSRTVARASRSLRPSALPLARSQLPRLPTLASSLPIRFFSHSAPRLAASALSTKLAEEIKFEVENAEAGEPDFLKDFKATKTWAIEDVPGADEVVLTRSYGNENIRILFSISDLDAEQEHDAEEFVDEESADAGSGGVGDEESDTPGGPSEGSFPVETTITVTKPGQGALTIDACAQDGLFTINSISFYNDAELALGLTSEEDWKRQGLYIGPEFDNLDENVQAEFENYLEERGINSGLALFIPDICEYKEQKEYLSWLKNVKSFVEA